MRQPAADDAPEGDTLALRRDALRALGVKRLRFAIHDASFPSDPDEDVGRGSPSTAATERLLGHVRRWGFDGVQLGPQGMTSRDNASPYDGTIFSRSILSIPLSVFVDGPLRGAVSDAALRSAVLPGAADRADHRRAFDTWTRLLDDAQSLLDRAPPRALTAALGEAQRAYAPWLERDALYTALAEAEGGKSARDWSAHAALFAADVTDARALASLRRDHRRAMARYSLGQLLAHRAHDALRERAAHHGLTLHADLQTGLSEVDRWAWSSALLDGYAMGAPPSRTTAAGQPWGYPILDPGKMREPGPGGDAVPGPALRLLALRFQKSFAEYDGVRVDHPHALVCPWVYRTGGADPWEAVRSGARLFESPDLPDHPALARFAIARADQIDRARPRHADDWVRALDPAQIDRYAVAMDLLLETARRYGRDASDIACEALSTMPRPLGAVLERLGLGRFRVVQKAALDDPSDVYRADNARKADWMMLSTHDTPSIWAVLRSMPDATRSRWVTHLGRALALSADECASLARTPGLLAHAMLAEIFASAAENVMIFFTDLFGFEERYNEPGTIGPHNWSLRLPPTFEDLHRERAARLEALDADLALAMALDARAETRGGPLARALRARVATPPGA